MSATGADDSDISRALDAYEEEKAGREFFSRIVRVEVGTARFRLHLTGTGSALRTMLVEIPVLSSHHSTPGDFLDAVARRCGEVGVTLADTLDLGASLPRRSLVSSIRIALSSRDAQKSFIAIQIALADADPADLDSLLASDDLQWVREALASVVYDLDEHSAAAVQSLRDELAPHVAYALLP